VILLKQTLDWSLLLVKIGKELINKYLYILYSLSKGLNVIDFKESKGLDFKEWKAIYLATGNNSFINTPTIASVLDCKKLEFFEAYE
jgi:hypothetical protein